MEAEKRSVDRDPVKRQSSRLEDLPMPAGPLATELRKEIAAIVREENELLLKLHTAMKPLLTIRDTATTLGVSERTVEKLIGSGKIRVLWIKGQRKIHPDALEGYMRTCEQRTRRRAARREVVR